jgi:hypothetical protein
MDVLSFFLFPYFHVLMLGDSYIAKSLRVILESAGLMDCAGSHQGWLESVACKIFIKLHQMLGVLFNDPQNKKGYSFRANRCFSNLVVPKCMFIILKKIDMPITLIAYFSS